MIDWLILISMTQSTFTISERFIVRARQLHKKYDYSHVTYHNSKSPVTIKCPLHGLFQQTPNAHLMGHGCPYCGNSAKGKSLKSNTKDFIDKAQRMFGDRYDYSLVVYKNATDKIIIQCKNHGNFLMSPNDHLSGHGCKECGRLTTIQSRRSCKKKFLEQATIVHSTRYDYSEVVYTNNSTKVKIICPTHGAFWQSPNNHLNGQECPRCNLSRGEWAIEKYLISNNISYCCQKTFDDCRNPLTNRKLRFDFYLPQNNMLIEYDGTQHFRCGGLVNGQHRITLRELSDIQAKDTIKTDYAKSHGIRLLRIPYTEFSSINKLLEMQLSI